MHIYHIVQVKIYFIWHSALVWGSSVKHQPQKVGKEHVLADEDVVQIVKKFVSFCIFLNSYLILFLFFSENKLFEFSKNLFASTL